MRQDITFEYKNGWQRTVTITGNQQLDDFSVFDEELKVNWGFNFLEDALEWAKDYIYRQYSVTEDQYL